MSYLIDTNVICELVRPKPHVPVLEWFQTIPNELLYISVLTLGEIRKGLEKMENNDRQRKLRIWLEVELVHWFQNRILVVNPGIADRWGLLQAQMKRPLPVIDSLIAATALHHDLSIITRNQQEFNYPLLQVINLWND